MTATPKMTSQNQWIAQKYCLQSNQKSQLSFQKVGSFSELFFVILTYLAQITVWPGANLNTIENFMTNTTTASKYITR